jgi:molecular chaperone DnaK (HSP70)
VQWQNTLGSLEGETSEKAPTQLCYHDDKIKWGFGIPEEEARYLWFKLGLDPAQKHNEISLLAVNYPDPKAMPPAYDDELSPVQLTIDYLAQLHQHTDKILRRKLGDTIMDTTAIRYTITVPAIWSDAAKAKTVDCATKAGLGRNIGIISEPEAAVVHALDALNPHDLKVGENFVLCDAGGGTVDLISKFSIFQD